MEATDVRKETTRKKKEWPPTIFGFIILIISMALANAIRQSIDHPHWNNYTIGTSEPYLYISLPAKPQSKTIDLPKVAQNTIQKVEHYQCKSDSAGIDVLIQTALYKDNIIPNLDSAVEGILSQAKNSKGVSNLRYKVSSTTVSGRKGKLLTVSAIQDQAELEMKFLIVADNLRSWLVMVEYRAFNKAGREAAERVINSVKLSNHRF